jgi:hypothetical protein
MWQRPGDRLEVVDDAHAWQIERLSQSVGVDNPTAVGQYAAICLDRSGYAEHRARDWQSVPVTIKERGQRPIEVRIIGDRQCLDRPHALIRDERKPGIGPADITQQCATCKVSHGFPYMHSAAL